jgi:hypothetical protein
MLPQQAGGLEKAHWLSPEGSSKHNTILNEIPVVRGAGQIVPCNKDQDFTSAVEDQNHEA